jgi:hypothetical protein
MALRGLWRSIFSRNRNKWKVATLFPAISLAIGAPVRPEEATPEALHAIVSRLAGASPLPSRPS